LEPGAVAASGKRKRGADALRYLAATKSRAVVEKKLRGL